MSVRTTTDRSIYIRGEDIYSFGNRIIVGRIDRERVLETITAQVRVYRYIS